MGLATCTEGSVESTANIDASCFKAGSSVEGTRLDSDNAKLVASCVAVGEMHRVLQLWMDSITLKKLYNNSIQCVH